MTRSVLFAMIGGCIAALLLLAGLGGPLLGALFAYFTPLPMLCVGLGLGAGAVPIAAAAGIVCIVLLGPAAAAAVFGGMHALPSWLVAYQALLQRPAAAPGGAVAWTPPGDILASLSVLAAVALTGFALFGAGGVGIEAALGTTIDEWLRTAMPNLSEVDRQQLVEAVAPLFFGIGGIVWIATTALNAGLAQAILVSRGRNLRPTPRWSDLAVPDWLSWALVGAAVVALIGGGDLGYLARNVVLVFAAPFFLVGLAVMHRIARGIRHGGVMLAAFYIALFVMPPGVGAAAALLGIIEQWIGVRRRLPGAGTDGERP